MITISNISFFRFCWKNRKLDWPKCARAQNTGYAAIYYSNRGVSTASFLVQQNQLVASNNFIIDTATEVIVFLCCSYFCNYTENPNSQ